MRDRPTLLRTAGLLGAYVASLWFGRLVFITIAAYIFVRSKESLQRVDDLLRSNQVLIYAISAGIFSAALSGLHPLTRTNWRAIFDVAQLRRAFASNALGGAVVGSVLIVGTLLGGHLRWLGIYMRFDEVVLTLASALVFTGGFFLLVTVEEYLVRRCLEPRLSGWLRPAPALAASCAIYVILKSLQFDVNWLAAVNLTILNVNLSMIARREGSHMASASFAAAFLIVLHTVFGLPFLGQDMPGICLLRPASEETLTQLLSGGRGGPESGLVLTILLTIYMVLPQTRTSTVARSH